MSTGNDYLVSLRNDTGEGVPGPDMGNTTYISVPNTSDNYNLTTDKVEDRNVWAQHVKETAKGGPVVVFIHGYHNNSTKVLGLHNDVHQGLSLYFGDRPFSLVSYDWPTANSVQEARGAVYPHDWENALTSGRQLAHDCIDHLIANGVAAHDVHIITHSMGGRVAEVAFSQNPPSNPIGHVMLTAADISAEHYDVANNSIYLKSFTEHSISFTSYHSEYDQALKTSATVYGHLPDHGKTRLGQVGFTDETTKVVTTCQDMQCGNYYLTYVKPTDHGAETSHKWYVLPPTFYLDFMEDTHNVITGTEAFPNRLLTGATGQFILVKGQRN